MRTYPAPHSKPASSAAVSRAPASLRGCVAWLLGSLAILMGACHELTVIELDGPINAYRDRMLAAAAQAATPGLAAASQPAKDGAAARLRRPTAFANNAATARIAGAQRESLLVQPAPATQPAPAEVMSEIPDPVNAEVALNERLAVLEAEVADSPQPEMRVVNNYRRIREKTLRYLDELRLPNPRPISLAECIQRALENSYIARIEAFNPAISRTQVVEAEAAFDAIVFLESSYTLVDQPTPSQLAASGSDTRIFTSGVRKLLPTGAQVSTSLQVSRTFIENFEFQQLNPAYESSLVTQFTQPLLRGFGLDYNRSTIRIQKLDQEIAEEQFIQRVREVLLQVESAYWTLARARREVMIQAETAAQNAVTFENIYDRRENDATPVEINNSLARWRQREVAFKIAVKQVRDAEDALKNVMNDPDLRLSQTIELIPTEVPLIAPLAVDQFAEVRTAIDERNEIRAARLRIEQARIQSSVAKNETLPQLDLTFSYEVQGLGNSADNSFDQLTQHEYTSYSVGVQFSYPIGNRGPEARRAGAELRERQARVDLNRIIDNVVLDVNNAVRDIIVGYQNIPTQFDTVVAAERNLRALQARTPTISPTFLETELQAVDQLNSARSNLLTLVTQYNISIVELESAKGTLLRYNNVMLADDRVARR